MRLLMVTLLMMTAASPPAATGCNPPMLGSSMDVKAEPNYPQIGKLQMDMMVSALQCGLTRVASLQWGNSNDQCSYSWLGIKTLGHYMAHNNNNCDPDRSKKLKTYRWYSEQAAYLLGRLSAIPEGNGTMLDNTLVLWASEFGESNGHVSNNLMWLLMGNADGQFRSGRVLNCGGRSTNDLLTSLCNAFGIADKTYGNPAYCAGPLSSTASTALPSCSRRLIEIAPPWGTNLNAFERRLSRTRSIFSSSNGTTNWLGASIFKCKSGNRWKRFRCKASARSCEPRMRHSGR